MTYDIKIITQNNNVYSHRECYNYTMSEQGILFVDISPNHRMYYPNPEAVEIKLNGPKL